MRAKHFVVSIMAAGWFAGWAWSAPASRADEGVFAQENLVAWCIVPFDEIGRAHV